MAIKPLINEAEVLAKIAGGDEYAFTELFNWYYQPLGQSILRLTESLEMTQEIVQDAFVKIWLRRETITEIDNFNGYLFILCRNQAFTTLKRLAREKKLQPLVEQHMQWESEMDDLENPSEHYRELIQHAVAKLPAQQQKIYELSRYERLKYEEIAEKLGLSSETVKTQVYNAVKFIRKELSTQIAPGLIIVLTSVLTINS
jgi:RNA polymerase sigma-70 factor (ECF subfamily)